MHTLIELADGYRYDDGTVQMRVGADGLMTLIPEFPLPKIAHRIDVGRFHAIVTLLRGITDTTRVHPVNTPLLSDIEHVASEAHIR
jgi:hypothetical protein